MVRRGRIAVVVFLMVSLVAALSSARGIDPELEGDKVVVVPDEDEPADEVLEQDSTIIDQQEQQQDQNQPQEQNKPEQEPQQQPLDALQIVDDKVEGQDGERRVPLPKVPETELLPPIQHHHHHHQGAVVHHKDEYVNHPHHVGHHHQIGHVEGLVDKYRKQLDESRKYISQLLAEGRLHPEHHTYYTNMYDQYEKLYDEYDHKLNQTRHYHENLHLYHSEL